MPPKASYADRVFTTSVVSYPEMMHIGEDKDFTPVIEKALELGGYSEDKPFTGINGGSTVMTGFARGTVLGVADQVIEAVKSGAIRRFPRRETGKRAHLAGRQGWGPEGGEKQSQGNLLSGKACLPSPGIPQHTSKKETP